MPSPALHGRDRPTTDNGLLFPREISRFGEPMADITAKLVNELRSKTGQPMMDCKKMLEKTGGDMSAAVDEFRKKGIKSSLSERSATEGRVAGVAAQDSKSAALVEVNCNTDFTAKSEPYLKL